MEIIKPEEVVDMFSNPRFLNALSGVLSISACVTTGWATVHAVKVKQSSSSTGIKKMWEMSWRYLIAAGLEGGSIYCGSHGLDIQEKKTIDMAAWGTLVYGNWLLEKQSNKKMLESEFGPRKVENLEAKQTEAYASMLHPIDREQIINTGEGNQLFFDTVSRTYFWSSYEAIAAHLLNLARRYHDDPFCSWITVNEYLNEIGLKEIPFGGDYGWTNALFSEFPVKSPDPGKAIVDGRSVNCAYMKTTDTPIHESVKRQWDS